MLFRLLKMLKKQLMNIINTILPMIKRDTVS